MFRDYCKLGNMSCFLLQMDGKTLQLFLRNQYQMIIWRKMLHSLVPWEVSLVLSPSQSLKNKVCWLYLFKKSEYLSSFCFQCLVFCWEYALYMVFSSLKNRMVPLFVHLKKVAHASFGENAVQTAFHFELKDWLLPDSKWILLLRVCGFYICGILKWELFLCQLTYIYIYLCICN